MPFEVTELGPQGTVHDPPMQSLAIASDTLTVTTTGPGLFEISADVHAFVKRSGVREGTCTLTVLHTSASLVIQENADPDVRRDLQAFFERLEPEGDPLYRHVAEGPDDMPAHVKSALLPTTITLSVSQGHARLGRWQGVYCWEHRRRGSRRKVAIVVMGTTA